MFLIQLDSNNAVTARLALTDPTVLPLNTPLDASYMFVGVPINIGQIFDDETGTFSAPSRSRWLTRLAFDNRFTMTEATSLKLAQMYPARLAEETDAAYTARCTVPAMVQVMQSRLNLASYIDLDRADTRSGVQQLEVLGLLTAGRALEILDGPIAEPEYHPTA